jgi:methylphosphotriester-DNA--protein-cysteine methyltransferase
MLRTLIHRPNGLLKDHVLFIAIREFDCFQEDFFKHMHAKHEIHMMFMIIGLSPKLFARIRRFNQVMVLKTYQSNLTWMDICYQTGYYDPMHLVKDFNKFAGLTPT